MFLKSVLFLLTAISLHADIGLISVQEAQKLIAEAQQKPDEPSLVVLDTRGGYKDYFRGHLPAAQHLNFDTLRGTAESIPVQYLPDDLTAALLKRAGAHPDRLHLIYATGESLPNDEILSSSMVAHVLEKFGVKNIKIIDGGLAEWTQQGFASTQEYFSNSEGSDLKHSVTDTAIDLDTLMNETGDDVLLVDARPLNEYRGEDDVWIRKGHIPGAISFHWARLMESDNTHKFRPLAEVKAELEKAGITPDKKIIAYCGTSREGSLLRFYLKHVAGYPNVRLYEGAWKEYAWVEDQSLPIEKGGEAAGK